MNVWLKINILHYLAVCKIFHSDSRSLRSFTFAIFNFHPNFFTYCLFSLNKRYFLIVISLFVEEEKPAAMHGGDRRNATSRASINVMLIFLTFLGIRISNQLRLRQTCITWPAHCVNFVTELMPAAKFQIILIPFPLALQCYLR